MPGAKIAYVTALGDRADFIKSQAPPDVEVTMIDINLPDATKSEMCRDADAVISSNVSVDVLREWTGVKLIQTLSAGFDRLDVHRNVGED